MIKCLNPFCQNRKEYHENICYCPKCGYSQGAGWLIQTLQKASELSIQQKKDISDAKKYAYRI